MAPSTFALHGGAVDRPAPDPVFAPVRSQTAFEETLERLGTAIRLGLLEPGARLPAERDLCAQLGHLALDAAPGADGARPERAPARRARPPRRDVRGRAAAAQPASVARGARGLARGLRQPARHRARRRGAGLPARRPGRARAARRARRGDAGAARGLPRLPPRGRALPRRPRRDDGERHARVRDDGGPGRHGRADRPHRPPARGAGVLQRAAPGAAGRGPRAGPRARDPGRHGASRGDGPRPGRPAPLGGTAPGYN